MSVRWKAMCSCGENLDVNNKSDRDDFVIEHLKQGHDCGRQNPTTTMPEQLDENGDRMFTNPALPGRLDVNGVEWWACSPYPTWYRWEKGELYTNPAEWAEWPVT